MCGNGSHTRNQTAPAAHATKAMRMSSTHSNPCSCSACFESFLGRFISREAGLSEKGTVVRVFSADCGALIMIIPSVTDRWLFQIRFDHLDHFVGGHCLLRSGFLPSIEHVTPYVALQQFGHQAVHGPSGRAHHL